MHFVCTTCVGTATILKIAFGREYRSRDEALAVNDRLETGKPPPNLIAAECHCRFFSRYLLPCRHIFHGHMFGQHKLLTESVWHSFQVMFAESGFEVYQHRECVTVPEDKRTRGERDSEHLRVRIEEINEKLWDMYFSILEGNSIEKTAEFIGRLEVTVEPLLKRIEQ
jgi:hypothetical protein